MGVIRAHSKKKLIRTTPSSRAAVVSLRNLFQIHSVDSFSFTLFLIALFTLQRQKRLGVNYTFGLLNLCLLTCSCFHRIQSSPESNVLNQIRSKIFTFEFKIRHKSAKLRSMHEEIWDRCRKLAQIELIIMIEWTKRKNLDSNAHHWIEFFAGRNFLWRIGLKKK